MRLTILSVFFSLLISFPGFSQSGSPVSYTIPERLEVKAGSSFTISSVFKVEDSWYIYAPTGNNAAMGMVETNIIFMLPAGITRVGRLQLPSPQFKNGHETYFGKDIVFSQQFVVGKDVRPGEHFVKARITYQTCTSDMCLPPVTDEVTITIVVSATGASVPRDRPAGNTTINTTAVEKGSSPRALNLRFTAMDGRKVDLKKLKGKLVLIDCWATWCRPCIAEFDNLKKMYQKYHAKGLEIIGITMDEAAARPKVNELLKKHQLPWPQYFEGKGFNNNSIVQQQRVVSLPTVFLIDRKGNIVDRDARGERLEELIKEHL
jgi:thiol-disulfide isomerase/thioredoxin